jgi:uncharacterized DUF497 family protein
MSNIAKNTEFETFFGFAEIFWQTKFADHLLENRRDDAKKPNYKERIHDLKFEEISMLLQQNHYLAPDNRKQGRFRIITKYRGKYYLIIYHLTKRKDLGNKLFAVIVTSYITYEAKNIRDYENHFQNNSTKGIKSSKKDT